MVFRKMCWKPKLWTEYHIWVVIFRGRFIGPYVYEGNLTAARYLEILREFVEPIMDDLPLQQIGDVYFQQDGAPCHNAHIITAFLNEIFIIKDLTYKRHPDSREALEAAVRHAFRSMPAIELINAVNNVRKRSQLCFDLNGAQFEHML